MFKEMSDELLPGKAGKAEGGGVPAAVRKGGHRAARLCANSLCNEPDYPKCAEPHEVCPAIPLSVCIFGRDNC
jgi:hypothetical protein